MSYFPVLYGTWTPALKFGAASVGMTYGTQSGVYTKIGRELICYFSLILTAKGASTGAATITGLPFTSGAIAAEAGAGGLVTIYAALATLNFGPILNVATGGTIATLLQAGAAATAALDDTNFTDTSTLKGWLRYPTA